MASCSCAAGRRVSSEAISTLRFSRSVQALGDLGGGGGLAGALQADHQDGDGRRGAEIEGGLRSRPGFRPSCVMDDLDDHLAGLDRLDDLGADGLFAFTFSVKVLTTSRATSASSRARRTSRSAASTSASDSAPRPVSLSNMPVRRSLRVSNMHSSCNPKRKRHPGAKLAAGCWPLHLPGTGCVPCVQGPRNVQDVIEMAGT
jgi:hypothetical protein